jgi:hypothetical protein
MVEYGWALHRGLPAALVALSATFVAGCTSTNKPPTGDTSSNGEGGPFQRDAGVDSTEPEASVVDSYVGDVSVCEAGLSFCGGGCVDTKKDPSNCGMCTNQCGGVFQCVGGQCLCPVGGGQAICSNTCVNTATDPGNCGACGHTCQGSVCANSLCQPTVVATQTGAAIGDIAVDPQNIYFSQVASGSDHGRVIIKPFAGSSPGVFIDSTIDSMMFDPRGVAFDNQNMYWVDNFSGAIESVSPISGGYGLLRPSMLDGGTTDRPLDIVSDGHDVYWATFDGGQIISVPIGGGPQTVIASGLDHPKALAFDANNIYWVDFGGANPTIPTGSIKQAPKGAPSTPATLVVLSRNENQPWDVAVDDTSVYWTLRTNPGLVKKVPIGGTGPVVTLAKGQGSPYGIAVDADFVYWTNYDDNTVVRLPKGGTDAGSPFVLANGQNNPSSLATDAVKTDAGLQAAQNVYWATGAGTILKVAR